MSTYKRKLIDDFIGIMEDGEAFQSEILYNYIVESATLFSEEQEEIIIDELKISDNNIETKLNNCAAKIYYYGCKQNEADSMIDYIEELLSFSESEFMKSYRLENPKTAFKEKESDIRRLLNSDETWTCLNMGKNTLNMIKREYANICRGFEIQARMLMSINKRELFKQSQGM